MSAHTRQRRAPLLPLGIVVAQRGTTTIIELAGEWDRSAHGAARTVICRVLARRPGCVVLDLSRVSSIDASGVRVVVELARRSELEHVHFVIVAGPPAVQHVFAHCPAASKLLFIVHGAPRRSADRLASTLPDSETGGPLSRHRWRRSPLDPPRRPVPGQPTEQAALRRHGSGAGDLRAAPSRQYGEHA